jgi:hypothetical protein
MSARRSKECRKCLNSTANPTIVIGKNGLCGVCRAFADGYDPKKVRQEEKLFRSFIGGKC